MTGRDPAKARFIAIAAMRFVGAAMVMLGLLIANGKVALPQPAGYALVLFGLFDAFVMPSILARRWKSPPR